MKLPITFPKNRTRQRKLLLWASRNCAREADRRDIDPSRAADLRSWADAFTTALNVRQP